MQAAVIRLNTPIDRGDILKLRIGDIVEFTGVVYTARDAAHLRIRQAIKEERPLDVDFSNQFIFYAGPCPAKPGRPVGPIAPTTSMRMDRFAEMTFELGILGMIGKGDRNPYVAELCKRYGGVYLLGFGGVSALLSTQVRSCVTVAYDDLGPESIKRLEVENMRLVVGIDSDGCVFEREEIPKYAIV